MKEKIFSLEMLFKTYQQQINVIDNSIKLKCSGKFLFEIKDMNLNQLTESSYYIRINHESLQISTSKITQKKPNTMLSWN